MTVSGMDTTWNIGPDLNKPFHQIFLYYVALMTIIMAMIWIIIAGLILRGPTTPDGYFHFVSDGFSSMPVVSTLVLGLASHFVFVIRVAGALNLVQSSMIQSVLIILMPFIAGCGLVVLRFDVVQGQAHVMTAALAILFSIVFYDSVYEHLSATGKSIFTVAVAASVLFVVTWVAYLSVDDAHGKKELRFTCGCFEYVLIECIFMLDIVLLNNLNSQSKAIPAVPDKKAESSQDAVNPQKHSVFKITDKRGHQAIKWRI